MRASYSLLILSIGLVACSGVQHNRIPASTPNKYPINVIGADEASFTPTPSSYVVEDSKHYDVVVVGAGLAGLSTTVFLSDAPYSKRVLLLEKQNYFGGLAAGETIGHGVVFGRGAAYWTDPYKEEKRILNHIGLADMHKKNPIPEPIDSFYWNGEFYRGIWDEKTLEKLPASFALFKQEIQNQSEEELIPDQPIEEAKDLSLDKLSAAEWIRAMPEKMAQRTDKESRKIYERFQNELASGRVPPSDPMEGVVGLMDLYCRSALGSVSKDVSAVAFANFYISEIQTRFTSEMGTGEAAKNMEKMLRVRKGVKLQANATVTHIENTPEGVIVEYVNGNTTHRVHANYAVYAGQLHFAPQIIKGLEEQDPEKAKAMGELRYAHYSVHTIETKGNPYRVTYDTWVRTPDESTRDFTDVILGRWMNPAILGYRGYRNFKKDPQPDIGVFSIYHPLDKSIVGKGYTDEQAKQLASEAIDRWLRIMGPLAQRLAPAGKKDKAVLDASIITRVDTNRWPYSVHLAEPGHFSEQAKVLRRPLGHIFFANNNIGTPAFEEALFRGHCAAVNILKRTSANYHPERWTHCPIEP